MQKNICRRIYVEYREVQTNKKVSYDMQTFD